MSTTGKVFLAFNLLLAAGLAWAAGEDWKRRQEIAAAIVRHRLVLSGLPVAARAGAEAGDGVPVELPTPGGRVVETVEKELLAAHFRGADGGSQFGAGGAEPPAAQVAEAERVRGKVKAVVAAAGGPDGKLVLLCGTPEDPSAGWLTRMAETFEERELLRRMAAEPTDEAAKQAEEMLERRFDAAVKPPDPRAAADRAGKVSAAVDELRKAPQDPDAQKKLLAALADPGPAAARDDADRRGRVAHLLMHLDPSADWQKRVALVVGLDGYRAAVAAHAERLRDMARSAQRAREVDQAGFVERYGQLQSLALDRAALVARQRERAAGLAAQKEAAETAANKRAEQLEARSRELGDRVADVRAKSAAQAAAEQALFDIQRRVGEAFRDLGRREAELADKQKSAAPDAGTPGL